MVSVEEAFDILTHHLQDFGVEYVSINKSTGRILREDISADRDMPPFDRVSMDGIAVQFDAFEKGARNFYISGMAAAGSPQQNLTDPSQCYEIMTGSILPLGADTIIPYEWLDIENGMANVVKQDVKKGQNVHRTGLDRKKGEILIPPGKIISPAEIGILASVGKSTVQVSALPKVLIISTGNELIPVDETPLLHQVRMSNVHQLCSCFQSFSVHADTAHLQDDYEAIMSKLVEYLEAYDVIVISGGISAGKYDFIPAALETLGVQKHFYKVQQRPGKPFWFGSTSGGCTVFAIPGNPVSSFLCFTRFIKPWLEGCLQKTTSQTSTASLAEDITFTPNLTYFMTVRLQQNNQGTMIAIPAPGHGSGDLANLVDADAFIELPAGRDKFPAGEVFNVFKF